MNHASRSADTCKMARKIWHEKHICPPKHQNMTRRRLIVLVGLGLSCVDATDSKSLTLQPPVSKFQVSEHSKVGLLDQGDGRCQVVHLPAGEPVSLPSRPGKVRRVKHVKASILTVGLFSIVLRNLLWVASPQTSDWAGFVILWILYIVEGSTCSTRRYLSNIRTPVEVKDIIHKFQQVAPRVRWNLECYHYEDDYRRSTVSRRGHTDSSTKRVTHRASEVYEFQQ
jgi:hypothetical protein